MFEEQEIEIPRQIGLVPPLPFGTFESFNNKALLPTIADPLPPPLPPPHLVTSSCLGGAHQLLSFNRSTANSNNSWARGEVTTAGDCMMMMMMRMSNKRSGGGGGDIAAAMKMKIKKMKGGSGRGRRKVREPRFCFKTMSDVDLLDDGYKWRKYGQKVVKNTQHPRSYYRCTEEKCRVKKQVERLAEDPRMIITTYEGRHVHSPSNDLQDSETASQLTDFLW
ncbi:WRKY Transcription Factor [Stylosanthes scabra]|uniref:WRKY Transcription Factor n=1 Tax=Stylosanthes scabra TaxID=79078 RepID=A0ABU6YKF0_9FABA|nr:WRKY Transcription Factor [Stylosanthes scabra]